MGHVSFDRCSSLRTLWMSLPREWPRSEFCLFETALPPRLAISSGASSAARVPSCNNNSSTSTSISCNKQQKKHATAASCRGSKQQQALLAKPRRLTWPMLTLPHVGAWRKPTWHPVVSSSYLHYHHQTSSAVSAPQKQGSTVNKAS